MGAWLLWDPKWSLAAGGAAVGYASSLLLQLTQKSFVDFPKPRNPQPSTLYPLPSTLDPQSSTLNPEKILEPSALIPEVNPVE